VSSPLVTEETGAMGREIESRKVKGGSSCYKKIIPVKSVAVLKWKFEMVLL
jgi:hypothetical protein